MSTNKIKNLVLDHIIEILLILLVIIMSFASKNFLTVCKPLDKRRLATELAQTGRQPMPADVKPLDSSICTDIKEMHYRLQMIPAP